MIPITMRNWNVLDFRIDSLLAEGKVTLCLGIEIKVEINKFESILLKGSLTSF